MTLVTSCLTCQESHDSSCDSWQEHCVHFVHKTQPSNHQVPGCNIPLIGWPVCAWLHQSSLYMCKRFSVLFPWIMPEMKCQHLPSSHRICSLNEIHPRNLTRASTGLLLKIQIHIIWHVTIWFLWSDISLLGETSCTKCLNRALGQRMCNIQLSCANI